MSEDFLCAARQDLNDPELQFTDTICNQALLDIEPVLIPLSRSLREFSDFIVPEPVHDGANIEEPLLIREHRRLSARLTLRPERQFEFNNDQQAIYDAINCSIAAPEQQSKLHFVDGPGRTGKTYLLMTFLKMFDELIPLPLLLLQVVLRLYCLMVNIQHSIRNE